MTMEIDMEVWHTRKQEYLAKRRRKARKQPKEGYTKEDHK